MSSKKIVLIEKAKEIISEYAMRLTLRQIYYRLVSKLIIHNTVNEYKYLSKILVEARYDGKISFDSIEDRTREIVGKDAIEESPKETFNTGLNYLKNVWRYYELPRWKDQPNYVEVWLEKQALSALFADVTTRNNVSLATCRGYPSLTFLYEAAERLADNGKNIQILYFGDLDPSGEDIYRYVQGSFARFGIKANFEKIAITQEQIIQYNIPPIPTKKSDSRSAKYIVEYGDIAVELDAIEPNILQDLIREAIEKHFDEPVYRQVLKEEEMGKVKIKKMIEKLGI